MVTLSYSLQTGNSYYCVLWLCTQYNEGRYMKNIDRLILSKTAQIDVDYMVSTLIITAMAKT